LQPLSARLARMMAENTYLKDGMDFISVHSLSETITDPLAALI
jgi:hypothetical protein